MSKKRIPEVEDARPLTQAPNPADVSDARLIAVFNPTAFELKRLSLVVDKLIYYQEKYTNVGNLKMKDALSWIGALKSLYTILRPLLYEPLKAQYDEKLNKILFKVYNPDNYKDTDSLLGLYKSLSLLTYELMEKRQELGLGIYVGEEREVSEKDLKERLI